MNSILEIDELNQAATVEPGVVLSDLKKATARVGLFYPPDPASAEFATVGGTVAECAGGLRCVKYGVTRDYIQWLEVVRIGGEVLRFGSEAIKSVSGYDVARLLVGSEGTLAVTSRIGLRLVPLPETSRTMIAVFSDDVVALEAGMELFRCNLVPSALEFIGDVCCDAAYHYSGNDLLKDARGILLIEFDGRELDVQNDCNIARDICTQKGAVRVELAGDEQSAEELWKVRRQLSPAIYEIAPTKINEDIAVPRSELAAVYREVKRIASQYDVKIPTFGHCGDGNLHVNFMFDDSDEQQCKRVEKAVRDLFSLVIGHHGTITGEHGIGIMKQEFIGLEYAKPELALMRQIKNVWDPHNLLNPGKIFPE
jgi:glycolate oxidase